MFLKKIRIEGFRAFYKPLTINIEETTTVLTGQNDVGKSALLRAIHMFCHSIELEEEDLNLDTINATNEPWHENRNAKLILTFVTDDNPRIYFPDVNVGENHEVDVEYIFATQIRRIIEVRHPSGKKIGVSKNKVSRAPRSIFLPNSDEIGRVIDGNNLSKMEKDFLLIGFGNNAIPQLSAQSDDIRVVTVARAESQLNQELSRIIPIDLGIELKLNLIPNPEGDVKFAISIRDNKGGFTPIHVRGSGIRKIVTLLASLMTIPNNEPIFVLFDEPENSLHSDSQHMLRKLLETISARPNVQVLYATHSTSMINTFDPSGLRLFTRETVEGRATTRVNHKPYNENYLPIRISLGTSPSDSLLYAPITVIVEGATEILSLASMLMKLDKENVEGFEDIEKVFSMLHFLDGQGNSFAHWCKMAKSQGTKPIVFVDGDKIKDVMKLGKQHPDVPIIHLPEYIDFEEAVPRDKYFEALSEFVKNVSIEKFDAWWSIKDLSDKMMFSKRVDTWLSDQFDTSLDKPQVMRKAIEITAVEEIKHIDVFRKLVTEIRKLVNSEV